MFGYCLVCQSFFSGGGALPLAISSVQLTFEVRELAEVKNNKKIAMRFVVGCSQILETSIDE